MNYSGKYIDFNEEPKQEDRKTAIWFVVSQLEQKILGQIRWYGAWRKYCFFVYPNTVYEQICLRDIADFCENRTKEYKSK